MPSRRPLRFPAFALLCEQTVKNPPKAAVVPGFPPVAACVGFGGYPEGLMAPALSNEDAERLRAFERAGHDLLAQGYADFFARVTAAAIQPLLEAVRLARGMRILDVATGPGGLAAAAAGRGADVVGVDLSPRMLELAHGQHPRLEFREADVERLPFGDATFDAIVCAFGIGHFPRPEAALAECLRTLQPGGRMALSWWDEPRRQRVQGLFRDAIAEVGVRPPDSLPAGHSSLRFCATGELLGLLQGAGLADAGVTEHAGTFLVESVDALWRGGLGSLVLTGSAIRHQDADTQEKVQRAFERRALAYAGAGAGGLRIPIAFKIGAGRKL